MAYARGKGQIMTDDQAMNEDWYSNETATFGDRLTDARHAVGMTQADLARRVGVKVATLANWENDVAEPRANRLNMLSGLLNVSLRWLLTGEGEGLSPPGESAALPEDVSQVLTEMRQTQADLVRMAAKVGRLEKQLKQLWKS